MASIVEFLDARIAEDEATAKASIFKGGGTWSVQGDHPMDDCVVEGADFKIYDEGGHDADQARHIALHDPARVLAECAAKRAIIAKQEDALDTYAGARVMDHVLAALAAVYANDPDYRQEWARG